MAEKLKGTLANGEVYYDEEGIVSQFLASNDVFISGQSEKTSVTLCVNCNDIFFWACADAEVISWPEDIYSLYEEYLKGEKWFAARWCSLKRKTRPQWCAVQLMLKDGAWTPEMDELPERSDNGSFGNPIIEITDLVNQVPKRKTPMPETGITPKPRVRKPKPRHPEVIIAAIDERLKCLPDTDANQFHVPRLKELLEELQRAIGGKFDEEAE